jgi:hypothetical protein
MRLLPIAAIAILALLGARPASAQAPSPDAIAAARELVAASRATEQLKTLLPMLMQQLKPAVVQGRPAVEKDYDAITPALIAASLKRLDEVADLMAAVYVRNFTLAEIRDVTAFYRTPTGQKLLEKMPIVMQESMQAGQRFAQAIAADLQKGIVDELRKRGHDVKI